MMGKLLRKLFPSKEIREYNKMHRRHRKELVKLAKETCEWDWSWLHRMVIMQIRHMYEYYSAGNNVWQVDESRLKIVEQLKHILDCDAEIERLEDDNFGLEIIEKYNRIEFVFPDDYNEKIFEKDKRVAELYQEIYSSIGRNLQCWWD